MGWPHASPLTLLNNARSNAVAIAFRVAETTEVISADHRRILAQRDAAITALIVTTRAR